jgi:hypothetical protein
MATSPVDSAYNKVHKPNALASQAPLNGVPLPPTDRSNDKEDLGYEKQIRKHKTLFTSQRF